MKTILALYDTSAVAREVIEDLRDAGFDNSQISVAAHSGEYNEYLDEEGYLTYDGDDVSAGEGAAIGAVEGGIIGLLAGLGAMAIPGIGPVLAAGPLLGALTGAGVGAVTGGIVGGLVDMGVPEEEAGYYAEGVRRGGTLVTVRTDDSRANEAAAIMNRHNPINLHQRVESWQAEGWTGYDADAEWYDSGMVATERDRYADRRTNYVAGRGTDVDLDVDHDVEGEQVIPVVEEELRIGKRTVQRGGVRISSQVEETPVEEQVSLREEHVHVERRPVDRAASDADLDDMELAEGTFEMTETAEEVVVDKKARVIEEVVISKHADTRTETVRDTVRRTNVDVEELDRTPAMDTTWGDFNEYEDSYRSDYDMNYATSGYSWNQYRPAYQYGHYLATHDLYGGRKWTEVEPEARQYWEDRNQGTWEEFKDAVRRGWNEVKQEVSEHV